MIIGEICECLDLDSDDLDPPTLKIIDNHDQLIGFPMEANENKTRKCFLLNEDNEEFFNEELCNSSLTAESSETSLASKQSPLTLHTEGSHDKPCKCVSFSADTVLHYDDSLALSITSYKYSTISLPTKYTIEVLLIILRFAFTI